ncbi:hypothetical protein [Lapidilactobacillus bayanensis]|uniref:hypothetical protein n=1 Tax=Lapidilactobacillus bayanensis TaxID=2485998 RepID=UPI000F76A036|nr:hypothetical protein [Lapidilactobacillus bayanensis]
MSIIKVPQLKIIGQVSLSSQIDPNGSFYSMWQELAADPQTAKIDQQLLKDFGQTNRVGLVVFAPESYLYWSGVAVPADFTVPENWQSYILPAGRAFEFQQAAPAFMPQIPVNLLLSKTFDQAKAEDVKLPESLGHAQQPYFLEESKFTDIEQIDQQRYLVYLSDEIEALEDDLD